MALINIARQYKPREVWVFVTPVEGCGCSFKFNFFLFLFIVVYDTKLFESFHDIINQLCTCGCCYNIIMIIDVVVIVIIGCIADMHNNISVIHIQPERQSWVDHMKFVVVNHYNVQWLVCCWVIVCVVFNVFFFGDIYGDSIDIEDGCCDC